MDSKIEKILMFAEKILTEEELVNFKYYLANRNSPSVSKRIECNINLSYYTDLLKKELHNLNLTKSKDYNIVRLVDYIKNRW